MTKEEFEDSIASLKLVRDTIREWTIVKRNLFRVAQEQCPHMRDMYLQLSYIDTERNDNFKICEGPVKVYIQKVHTENLGDVVLCSYAKCPYMD